MQYQSYKPGEDVFHHGDIGKLFYIIFTGSVSVHIPITKEQSFSEPELVEELASHIDTVKPFHARGKQTEAINEIFDLLRTKGKAKTLELYCHEKVSNWKMTYWKNVNTMREG